MSKHTELIERLRCFDRVTCNEAADALEAQALEIEALRKDAERYRFLRECDLDDMAAQYWPGGEVPVGEEFDAAIDAAKGEPHGIPPTT